eukprot:1813944-Pleurochrysis_carterae.AAC.1
MTAPLRRCDRSLRSRGLRESWDGTYTYARLPKSALLPLPARNRELSVAVARDPRYDQDTIFLTFAIRFLPRGEDIEEYAANSGRYYSTPPSIYQSTKVLWIEIWKDDHRGIIPVRLLSNTNSSAPEASLLGVRLTENTYRRLRSNMCSTAFLATLPEEFRRWNRDALEQAAQRRAAAEGEGSSDVPPGGATSPTAPLLETRQAEAPSEAGGT